MKFRKSQVRKKPKQSENLRDSKSSKALPSNYRICYKRYVKKSEKRNRIAKISLQNHAENLCVSFKGGHVDVYSRGGSMEAPLYEKEQVKDVHFLSNGLIATIKNNDSSTFNLFSLYNKASLLKKKDITSADFGYQDTSMSIIEEKNSDDKKKSKNFLYTISLYGVTRQLENVDISYSYFSEYDNLIGVEDKSGAFYIYENRDGCLVKKNFKEQNVEYCFFGPQQTIALLKGEEKHLQLYCFMPYKKYELIKTEDPIHFCEFNKKNYMCILTTRLELVDWGYRERLKFFTLYKVNSSNITKPLFYEERGFYDFTPKGDDFIVEGKAGPVLFSLKNENIQKKKEMDIDDDIHTAFMSTYEKLLICKHYFSYLIYRTEDLKKRILKDKQVVGVYFDKRRCVFAYEKEDRFEFEVFKVLPRGSCFTQNY